MAEKLKTEAEALASEGWEWIEIATDLPYGYSLGLRRLAGDPMPMTGEESASYAMGQGSDVAGSGRQPSASSTQGTVITSDGQPIGTDLSEEEEDESALKPLPERRVMELTAHRTLALREAIGPSR